MYGLDKDIDLSFLLKLTLREVYVGAYLIQLRFDEPPVINIESSVSIDGHYFEKLIEAGSVLLTSIGNHITSIYNIGDGDLTLLLSSGQRIVIHDSQRQYESYTITAPGRTIVV